MKKEQKKQYGEKIVHLKVSKKPIVNEKNELVEQSQLIKLSFNNNFKKNINAKSWIKAEVVKVLQRTSQKDYEIIKTPKEVIDAVEEIFKLDEIPLTPEQQKVADLEKIVKQQEKLLKELSKKGKEENTSIKE